LTHGNARSADTATVPISITSSTIETEQTLTQDDLFGFMAIPIG